MDEPIAIIGLDARFPGGCNTAERFYEFLVAGRSARTPVPKERYNVDAFWHPDADRNGTTGVRHAHFLKGSISAFDAPFFSITPTEARSIDPQQRGILETVYKALENAGIPLSVAAGTQTGVYIGCFSSDYKSIMEKDLSTPLKYAATGNVVSMLSNRVSWFFDFRGPSITVDTACSSSLVAAHQACMSLKLRETSMAVVGGCNLILSPELSLTLDKAGVLGPDGRSYSFDSRANGYARGEGFGVIVLKRLSDALRDGDTIRAIIRNSGTNQDGRSPGITQPTRAAQAELIKTVYSRASLDPSLTRFFEAHGTGTPVGDPIEAGAISDIFAPHRSPEQPLYVGALKSNVGHLEGAAGVAAIIKGVYTLEYGIIPANTNFERANPKIQDEWHLKFPTKALLWPQSGLRRMSINSFGVGGANAHMVLDDALHFLEQLHRVGIHRTTALPRLGDIILYEPDAHAGLDSLHSPTKSIPDSELSQLGSSFNGSVLASTSSENDTDPSSCLEDRHPGPEEDVEPIACDSKLYVWSSFDQDGCSRVQDSYKEYVRKRSFLKSSLKSPSGVTAARYLKDLSYTLSTKRTHHAWRSFTVANSETGLHAALSEKHQSTRALGQPRLAFIFTGQGAQWPAMGKELMSYRIFRQSIYDADEYFNLTLDCGWSLLYELYKDNNNSRINDAEFSQPLCTALQVALVDLLTSWNTSPHAVAGHSSGEVAAAYSAGHISRESAWKIAYYRGKLCANLSASESRPSTGMVAVALDRDQTEAAIGRVDEILHEGSLEIACMNSSDSHTVSGDADKVDALVEILIGEKIFARKLNVDLAYHSRHMKPIYEEYVALIGEIQPRPFDDNQRIRPHFYSSTFGGLIDARRLRDPRYWADNLVSPVRFHEAVTAMISEIAGKEVQFSDFITDFLEIGPHSALKGPLRGIIDQAGKGDKVKYHTMLKRSQQATETVLEAAGTLWSRGYAVDLLAANENSESEHAPARLLTDLPGYQFNHSNEYWFESRLSKNTRCPSFGRHELLGAPVPDWNRHNGVWRNRICLSENPWLEDHKVSGDILYPAAGMLVMAIEASRQMADEDKVVKGFAFREVSFHLALRVPDDAAGIESHFHLRPWRETGSGKISSWSEFQIFTYEGEEWREHCRGYVQTEYETAASGAVSHDSIAENFKDMKVVKARTLYDLMRDCGNDFGPLFRSLDHISVGRDLKAIAKVKNNVSLIEESMPHQYLQPHLIHPVTLDGVLQANLVPLILASKHSGMATVPFYAQELWISSEALGLQDSYTVHAQARRRGPQKSETCFTATCAETGRLMIRGDGFVLKSIAAKGSSKRNAPAKHIAFHIDWKPDPSLVDPCRAIRGAVPEEGPSHPLSTYEHISIEYLRRVLLTDQVNRIGEMPHHLQLYINWVRQVIDETQQPPMEDDRLKVFEQLVQVTAEGRLLVAVGQSLPQILGGKVDPLEVFFNTKLAEDFYQRGFGAERCFSQLCSYLDVLVHKNPAMEFLEIGAGTGGTTRSIMKTLILKGGQRLQNYEFTDLSPAFFEEARNVFKDNLGCMSFRALDIERDPFEQGFEGARYDIIVAANVLHATKNIEATLRNVRALLKSGGKLLLYEGIQPKNVTMNLIFGTLAGWWLSEEEERRRGPLMTAQSWDGHLKATGFTGLDAQFHDFPNPADQVCSILVSTATDELGRIDSDSNIYVIVQGESHLQRTIANSISESLTTKSRCEVVELTMLQGLDLQNASCIVLADLDSPVLKNMTEGIFSSLKYLVHHCTMTVWVSRDGAADPDQELITGFARVIRAENPTSILITIMFEDSVDPESIMGQSLYILRSAQSNTDKSFRIVDGTVCIPRVVEESQIANHVQVQTSDLDAVEEELGQNVARPLSLTIGAVGLLDTLRFEDDLSYETPLGEDQVEFKIMACGLDSRDLAMALGRIDEDVTLGVEASGLVTRVGTAVTKFGVGDRVLGISLSGAMKTFVRTQEGLLAKIPDLMSWTEAAASPLACSTAYAILLDLGSIQKGDTVLIHSDNMGLRQAMIQIAQYKGAEVFVIVDTDEMQGFVEVQRHVPRDHIFSGTGPSLRTEILRLTKSRGIDVIINTLSGETRKTIWDLVAPFGRFVELGTAHEQLTVERLRRNTRYEFFDFVFLARDDPWRAQRIFQRAAEFVYDGVLIWKMPITVYPFSQIQGAFQHAQEEKLTAQLVLKVHDTDMVPIIPSRKYCQFDPAASYVLAGGLGGLGQSIVKWMVSRGARNLILLSRRGATHESAIGFVHELKEMCENIVAPSCDAANKEVLRRTLEECLTFMPKIKGCIQGSLVLKDNRFDDMTLDEWNAAIRPKVNASWNLHQVLGSKLDFFVMLSSMMGIMGNREQSNYAAGNTFQDALARHRVSQGLPAVTLDLPVIEGVGFVAEKPELLDSMRSAGFDTMREDELHAVLDYHCGSSKHNISLHESQVVLRPGLPQSLAAAGIAQPAWLQDPLFNHLGQIKTDETTAGMKTKSEVRYDSLLATATSPSEAANVVLGALLLKLSRVLSVELSNLDPAKPLHAYGVDSLVAVDVRSWLLKELGSELSVFDMTSKASIYHLAETAALRSRFLPVFPQS